MKWKTGAGIKSCYNNYFVDIKPSMKTGRPAPVRDLPEKVFNKKIPVFVGGFLFFLPTRRGEGGSYAKRKYKK